MCRWLAFSGSPIRIQDALYSPVHSLIDQSLHSRLGAEPTNGDGFGLGWYDEEPVPGVFHSIEPAWNDQNLREITAHIHSRLFFAHIRAAIGSAVQQTNCHPFRHDRWLFMHNGYLGGFAQMKRNLAFAIDETLYPEIHGQTDTETLFYLALTFGLADDPPAAVARAIGLIEAEAKRHGIKDAFQGTIAASNGEHLWAFRYATYGTPRSLFFSKDVRALRELYPDREILHQVSDDARLILSEPIGDLPGAWHEVPESTWGMVGQGDAELMPFRPIAPAVGVVAGAPA